MLALAFFVLGAALEALAGLAFAAFVLPLLPAAGAFFFVAVDAFFGPLALAAVVAFGLAGALAFAFGAAARK